MTTSNEHNNAPSVQQGEQKLPHQRWVDGDEHYPRSEALYKFISDMDFNHCGDSFCFKKGGDGDKGETLMYILDCWFAATPAPAPAQDEPLGHFRAEPFGWTDCAEDDEGAIALYERPQDVGLTDADLLNWIERQDLEELSMGLVVDADHDGEYFVNGDDCVTYYGPTLRDAIDNAIRARKDHI